MRQSRKYVSQEPSGSMDFLEAKQALRMIGIIVDSASLNVTNQHETHMVGTYDPNCIKCQVHRVAVAVEAL